jgi:hypothetical protein
MPKIAAAFLLAILAAGLMVAGAILIANRWSVATSSDLVIRLDHWTGDVAECNFSSAARVMARLTASGTPLRCDPISDAESARLRSGSPQSAKSPTNQSALPYTDDLLARYAPKSDRHVP